MESKNSPGGALSAGPISRSFLWPPGTPGTGLARAPAYGVQEVQVERPCGSKALLRCTRCSQASRDQCHTCRCMPIAPRHTRRSSIPVTRNSPRLELPHHISRRGRGGQGQAMGTTTSMSHEPPPSSVTRTVNANWWPPGASGEINRSQSRGFSAPPPPARSG